MAEGEADTTKYSRYSDLEDGCIVAFGEKVNIACCDCGLVHVFVFRRYNGKLKIYADRDDRATGQLRRYHRHTCTKRRRRKGVE